MPRKRSRPIEKRLLLKSESGQNLLDARLGQRPDSLSQTLLVDRSNLRHDHDAPLWKIGFTVVEKDVPWLVRAVQIRSQGTHDDRRDSRLVEDVILYHHVGMRIARRGSSRI